MTTKAKQRLIAFLIVIVMATSIILSINLSLSASASTTGYMETPQITVLTHGLGGSAGHWSNIGFDKDTGKSIFGYDEASLLDKLSEKAGGANIYRANTSQGDTDHSRYSFKLIGNRRCN